MDFVDATGKSIYNALSRTHSYIENSYKQHLRTFVEVLLNYHDNTECRDLCMMDCGCKCHRRDTVIK